MCSEDTEITSLTSTCSRAVPAVGTAFLVSLSPYNYVNSSAFLGRFAFSLIIVDSLEDLNRKVWISPFLSFICSFIFFESLNPFPQPTEQVLPASTSSIASILNTVKGKGGRTRTPRFTTEGVQSPAELPAAPSFPAPTGAVPAAHRGWLGRTQRCWHREEPGSARPERRGAPGGPGPREGSGARCTAGAAPC